MNDRWYVVYNPASGKGKSKDRLQSLKDLLEARAIDTEIGITNYPGHEEELVMNAIRRGFRNLACAGGDGTLHHVVNGVMKQNMVPTADLTIAMIPSGTGNDWIKSHDIPMDAVKCMDIIEHGHRFLQDIGCIRLEEKQEDIFFVNVAGFGYDAYVVKNLSLFKNLGSLAYLFTGLLGFFSYRPAKVQLQAGSYIYKGGIFMVVLGIGRYSGGGMRLTDHLNRETGHFDATIVPDIGLLTVLRHLHKLYNGQIRSIKQVSCLRFRQLDIVQNSGAWIQADGELLGQGTAKFHMVPRAIGFLSPKKF